MENRESGIFNPGICNPAIRFTPAITRFPDYPSDSRFPDSRFQFSPSFFFKSARYVSMVWYGEKKNLAMKRKNGL